jgi:hypothetical protein
MEKDTIDFYELLGNPLSTLNLNENYGAKT